MNRHISSGPRAVNDGQRDFDHLLVNIFDDLSGDVIETVQLATHQILDVSMNFLETDVSHAIEDFHSLYEKNVELDSYKESIGENIDNIIRYVQEGSDEMPDLSSIDSEQLEVARLSLSSLQKDMEALAKLDSGMKEKVLPILHNMQFEDQLSSNILVVSNVWKTFINKTSGDNYYAADIVDEVYSKLCSARLRELFCEKVLRTQQRPGTSLPPDVIDKFLRSIGTEDEFFSRLQDFSAVVLQWSADDSASSVALIFDVISSVESEAEAAGDFSKETHTAFSSLKEIATCFNNPAKRESTKIMISLLQNRMNLDDNVQLLITPIMVAMQFQDRIRQNMENLAKTMEVWLCKRRELSNTEDELDLMQIGSDLINNMTMESEREIIRKHIPETPLYSTDSDNSLELF